VRDDDSHEDDEIKLKSGRTIIFLLFFIRWPPKVRRRSDAALRILWTCHAAAIVA
jgi:hypothetical protein